MTIIIFSFIILWLIRETKAILFWLYLWQLKEYRIDRFLDHFRTEKGKQLFLNKLFLFKIFLLFFYFFFFQPWWAGIYIFFSILFLLYFLESIKAFKDFFQARLKKPVPTLKAIFLFWVAGILTALFPFFLFFQAKVDFYSGLLIFDTLTPLIVSVIILFFQPLTILWKKLIIKKAKQKRSTFKSLLVIGITGSYGKSSTKEFLATILTEKFNVLKTKEHQNTEIGVSQCILNELKSEHEIFIVEMGAYKKGEIKTLCQITQPKIGIITGINEQHLALFGSMENLLSAEGGKELIDSLPEDGLVIFNGNNQHCFKTYQETKIKKKICSSKPFPERQNLITPDILAKEIKLEKEFISFKIFSNDNQSAEVRVNLVGGQNVENLLLAICCAKGLGMNLAEISQACQKITPEQGGIRLKKGKNGLNIIEATYSANPDSVISHLEYLKIWGGKKIIIMPCLIELGKATKEVHKRIGKKIGEICNLAIITTKEQFQRIKEGAIEIGMREDDILFLENPREIFEKIKNFNQLEDIILLEGRLSKELLEILSII